MKKNISFLIRKVAASVKYWREQRNKKNQREQDRSKRCLASEMMFIRAAQNERDHKKLEEELRQQALERIEWDETIEMLRSIEQSKEFER